MSTKTYDLVVFGATGFTGQYVVEEIARTEDEEGRLSWAVAGRSANKLQKVLLQASKSTGKELVKTPIILADVSDDESIQEMCKQAKIIINCVGPYGFYGEQVIKACIQHKTHHLDISGEPVFLEKMELDYDAAAKEAGVYVMESVGFDSIPAEMGVFFTRDQFKGDLNHAEAYLKINVGPAGLRLNFGTFQSGVHGFNIAKIKELKEIRRKMKHQPLPKNCHKPPFKWPIFRSTEPAGWCLPNDGPDAMSIERSQRFNYQQRKERPFIFRGFMCLPSMLALLFMSIVGLSFGIFSQFSLGRKLLDTFPTLMTLGLFSKNGPSKQQIEQTSFTMRIEGYGHPTVLDDISEKHEDKPSQKIVVKVTGPELAYVTTPICMVQAAYVTLRESDRLPQGGGVFTAGAAFAKTSLIERLNKHNVKFEVIQEQSPI